MRISKRVLQENKVRQISEKRTFLTRSTHTLVYVSGGKKFRFLENFRFEIRLSTLLPTNFGFLQYYQLTLSWCRSLSYRDSPLVWRANQWAGFYMAGTFVMKELNFETSVISALQKSSQDSPQASKMESFAAIVNG